MLGHDFANSVLLKVKAHIGIESLRERGVAMWRLPEHLQQIVLDTDRAMAAELVKAADLDEFEVLWSECAGREWLMARALAELAVTNE
jgi:hypothetical protein